MRLATVSVLGPTAGARSAIVLAACALAACVLAACDPPVKPDAAPSSSASAVVSAPKPEEPAPPPPADLDVAALQKALKCGGGSGTGPCAVLAKFAACKAWDPVVPSGDGRWLGRGTIVDGAKTTDQFTILRSRRLPTNDVGAGQLPVKIAVTDLPKEEGAAWDQADRAIRAIERADAPPRTSAALEYIKKRTEWQESFASRTTGGHVFATTQYGTFVCQGPKKQLLVVQRASQKSASPDGLYAELWPTSW